MYILIHYCTYLFIGLYLVVPSIVPYSVAVNSCYWIWKWDKYETDGIFIKVLYLVVPSIVPHDGYRFTAETNFFFNFLIHHIINKSISTKLIIITSSKLMDVKLYLALAGSLGLAYVTYNMLNKPRIITISRE